MTTKRTALASIFSFALIGLAGCGGGGESGGSAAPEEWPVRVTTSGDVESALDTNGSIYCSPNDVSGPEFVFELYAMSPPRNFKLVLNRDLAVGTYPIVGSDDDARWRGADVFTYYTGPDRQDFNRVENGSITIESMPTATGEALVASVQADMLGEDGAAIQLTADVNVTAGSQSFDDCP